ncbi:MAG: TIGR00341 family protein [Bacteroidales bacterium]|nr:TIGR00341 family protein [Bacteroidales bacterium]
MKANLPGRAKNFIVNYFSMAGYLVPQQEAEESIREGISFRGPNIVILILAILIASLGLNTNSTAVIIGAMLISPLMGPIIGIGLGVGIQDFELLKRSMRSLTMAAVFSVIASTVYFVISPVAEGHSELLARTSPTIYDVLIGFVGGGAGILAIGSRSKGNVIPGVAIATALMPPLCTAGYGLATWQLNYFFGAFYLFLINSIFICLATFIGVKLMKYKSVAAVNPERARRVRRTVYIIAVLTLLPSIYLTWSMLRQSRFQINAGRFVSEQCEFPSTHVLATNTSWHRGHGTINITLIGKVLPQDSLQMALASRLRFYNLEGASLNIVQGDSQSALTPDALSGNSVRDIYEMSQTLLAAKQETIDSLRTVIALANAADTVSGAMAPEIKVVFPQIRSLSMNRSVFAETSDGRLDTLDIALVALNRPLGTAKKDELSRYLEARLGLKSVKIVEYQ